MGWSLLKANVGATPNDARRELDVVSGTKYGGQFMGTFDRSETNASPVARLARAGLESIAGPTADGLRSLGRLFFTTVSVNLGRQWRQYKLAASPGSELGWRRNKSKLNVGLAS